MIAVGTSSWADPGFVEEWYPPGLPARDRLAYYAERFDAVEVNATFYAVPDAKTVERWVGQTHDGFTFDVKLHRRLYEAARALGETREAIAPIVEWPSTSGDGRPLVRHSDGHVSHLHVRIRCAADEPECKS